MPFRPTEAATLAAQQLSPSIIHGSGREARGCDQPSPWGPFSFRSRTRVETYAETRKANCKGRAGDFLSTAPTSRRAGEAGGSFHPFSRQPTVLPYYFKRFECKP